MAKEEIVLSVRDHVKIEEFVRVWVEMYWAGQEVKSIADHFGMTTRQVYYRADRLRGLGVKLPNFRERVVRRQPQIDKLNSIIEESER